MVNFSRHYSSITPHAIVLDLDETLVHTFTSIELAKKYNIFEDPELRSRSYYMELNDVSSEKGIGKKTILWGVVRPGVKEFLEFCFNYFKVVGVWSAGRREYVEAIVELLFRDIKPPNFVYTYDELYVERSGDYSKPLERIFNETNLGLYIKPQNIFMLDDRMDVCKHNPNNAIIIPNYSPETLEDIKKEDRALQDLTVWFLRPEVRYSNDITSLRKDIFHVR